MTERCEGAFIPKEMLECWETLRADGATWNVLIAIALQQYRYGGREAKITKIKMAERTGLSLSTVKRSVRKLREARLLEKLGRGRWRLVKVNMVTPFSNENEAQEGVIMVTPSKGHRDDPYPTLLVSLRDNNSKELDSSVFTPKQIKVINDVVGETSELLGVDALDLSPQRDGGSTSFREWMREIVRTGNKSEARDFVKALLMLRKDKRVVGTELVAE
jgi:DNA-binding transcriptional ArsR family regulator